MEMILSSCGLDCAACGAYKAYKTNDDEIRRKTAEEWSKDFNTEIKPEDINCAGCKSEGEVLLAHCSVCKIRECVSSKEIENCAYCEDYACDKLEQIFAYSKEAKMNLDEIRIGL